MCEIWRRDASEDFTVEQLRSQLGAMECLGVETVALTGGEPLMHAGLFDLCHELRHRGIKIFLLSSGLLLKRFAERIVENIDEVIVSLDGPPEVHDRIRNVPRAFELLSAGVARLRELKRSLPVAARCTVQRLNCRELNRTVQTARAVQLDSISFLAADTQSTAFDRQFPMVGANPIALTVPDILALDEQIEILEASGDCGRFVLESPQKLRRIAEHFRCGRGLSEPVSPICNAPWHSAVVETDGTVRPCFFHAPIGRIDADRDIATVINSPKAVAFRAGLDVASDPICRRCVCSLNWKAP
jgi:MoaA/NifB/PqqE/SkfB family radical SAM enzyme